MVVRRKDNGDCAEEIKARIVAGLSSIAANNTVIARISFGVVATAIKDIGDKSVSGCDAIYFFSEGLHAAWCRNAGLDETGVYNLLVAAGFLKKKRQKHERGRNST